MPILQKFLAGAMEEFADAVANGGGIYAVGYCFGAKYVLRLSSELPDTEAQGQESAGEAEPGVIKKEPVVKAGAIAHGRFRREPVPINLRNAGTMITSQDFQGLKAPVAIICAGKWAWVHIR